TFLMLSSCSSATTPNDHLSDHNGLVSEKTTPDSSKSNTSEDLITPKTEASEKIVKTDDDYNFCFRNLKYLSNKLSVDDRKAICKDVSSKPICASELNRPIIHFEKPGSSHKGKRILTLSLIHGDELASGTVTAHWMKRLSSIDSRNTWRVIPIANPDGWAKNTRQNSNGVDLNRNFPTKDWDELALHRWKTKKNKDPRRYPGPKPASERETLCIMQHIEEFKPDFIISIHTPLGILDFDGPNVPVPSKLPLPWQSLGNYPGSLGRYMWKDQNVPVLTIELKNTHEIKKLEEFDQLQDISGTVAIRANKIMEEEKKDKID
ncbi:MAG: DUF2817 domain-containing protein, partial [Bdellovibrionales bacterium]|nr:DUF2817 domain-containing protein [Bdellovibrionales bacterium]